MSGGKHSDDFDRRLAGQPADPAATTRELLASTGDDAKADPSMVFGDMRITELLAANTKAPKVTPLPWIVAAVLGLLFLVTVAAFVVPSWVRASDAETARRDAEQRLLSTREELDSLRSQVAELTRERDALAVESERRASELAEVKESMDEADATAKRRDAAAAAAAAKTPAKPSKRRKKRRR